MSEGIRLQPRCSRTPDMFRVLHDEVIVLKSKHPPKQKRPPLPTGGIYRVLDLDHRWYNREVVVVRAMVNSDCVDVERDGVRSTVLRCFLWRVQ